MTRSEWTLADLAAEWQLPLEQLSAARYLVGAYPIRRNVAGVPMFDRAAVSRLHRLLIEKDAAVLFECHYGERLAYLERELGMKLTRGEPLPETPLPEEGGDLLA